MPIDDGHKRHIQRTRATILCGHVHREVTLRWHGTMIAVTPSTGYQYELDLVRAHTIDPIVEPPACRICLWKPGVGLISHLSYIT